MKYIFLILMFLACPSIAKEKISDFDKLLPVLTTQVKGQEVSPQTTQELARLFEKSKESLPRVFVKKLPADFKEKGNKELFAKVIGALILRENEKILSERILFNILKQKYDKGVKWTKEESNYFDYLVEKYDVVVIKTIPTKINELIYKIDEIPLSMAIAQAANQTNWGKENLSSPYGQKGWKDKTHYDYVVYPNLLLATSAYVTEMNATPNFDMWRHLRMERDNRDTPKYPLQIASGLDVYMPEDVFYVQKIKNILKENTFLYSYDKLNFND